MSQAAKQVWVKIDGALSAPTELEASRFEIGRPYDEVHDVFAYARHAAGKDGQVIVYGTVCDSLSGQKNARAWLLHFDLDDYNDLTHVQTPPADALVIDSWPPKK